ncbi:MAG: three-Cys-motif partner protein TcmP, partial [Myxococcota bacterium]
HLQRLMQHPGVELFINVMWRELDMAMRQGPSSNLAGLLDVVFGTDAWADIAKKHDIELRAELTMNLIRTQVDAKWATYMMMLGDNGRTRYILLHLTNNRHGRDLMKDCLWNAFPDGQFYARRTDDPVVGLGIF